MGWVTVVDIGAWLRKLRLGRYEEVFRAKCIYATIVPTFTADDLKNLGIDSLDDRKRLLEAIAP
jgi:hypothetical protein